MSSAMEWLKSKAPGFSQLSEHELAAITDFSLLWSLFESRVLECNGNAQSICGTVDDWHKTGTLNATIFDDELAYFQSRYYANHAFTHHFGNLNLRTPDRRSMVRAVLEGDDTDPANRLAAALIIVYRYRNNLFHGGKWQYELAGQLGNFNAANSILMKALDRHGQLSAT